MAPPTLWTLFGLLGQLLFSGRFLVQWLASERLRRSVVPEAFWHLSLAGGLSLFIYACWRQDPVFILGQGLGLGVYARNLYLIHGSARNRTVGDGPGTRAAGAGAGKKAPSPGRTGRSAGPPSAAQGVGGGVSAAGRQR